MRPRLPRKRSPPLGTGGGRPGQAAPTLPSVAGADGRAPGSGTHRHARTPTADELLASYGAAVPDLVAPGLRVLLCGINPSLWSGWSGLHFGRPGNRLWLVLHRAGFTEWQLRPEHTGDLLSAGLGVTNLVQRATARADELADTELRDGVGRLERACRAWQPAWVAVLGLSAYRTAFDRPRARPGRRAETLGGSGLWLLPNPSGLNASYQLPALTELYAELRAEAYP